MYDLRDLLFSFNYALFRNYFDRKTGDQTDY